jgi:uncharacterized protein
VLNGALKNGFAVVDALEFNIAQLLRDPVGASRRIEVAADLRSLTPELGLDETSEALLTGPVRMIHTNAGVLVQGSLYAQTTQACARCLEPVAVPVSVELEEVYSPTLDILTGKSIVPEEKDRALWIDEHHVLDLTEVLRQDMLVAMPLHVLCREDCRGLCPTCGQNRNEGPCGCEPEPDSRWGPLVELLKQAQSNT